MSRIGVVGAGITGLTLANELRKRDVDVVVFEADDKPGGVIQSGEVDGRVLEFGPQRARLAQPLETLTHDLGITDALRYADDELPLFVYHDGALREVPRSLRGMLRTDLLSWRGRLRLLGELFSEPIDPEETVAEAFSRKFGTEAYRRLLGPLFGGIYGSDPAQMPARYALDTAMRVEERSGSLVRAGLSRYITGDPIPPPVSFEGGLQTLPKELAERHPEHVHLGEPVEGVTSGSDNRYDLVTEDRTTGVESVVLTTAAPDAATIVDELDADAAGRFGSLTYNPLVLVHLHSDVSVRGFGYQVARPTTLETLGVTFNDSLFGDEGVYSVYLGGMHDPTVLDRPPEELGETARREFETVLGAEASVIRVTRLPQAFPAYDHTWSALDGLELPDGVHLAANFAGGLGIAKRVREARALATDLAGGD